MKTNLLSGIVSQAGNTPVLLPFYSAQAENCLERGSRPYTVVEILREVFNEDFYKAIQCYMDGCPEGAGKAIGVDGASGFKLVGLSEPRVESSLRQPHCITAVDLIFKAAVEALVPMDEDNGIIQRRNCTAEFRVRYMLNLWDKKCSAPIIAPNGYFPSDVITRQEMAVTNQYLLPVMYAKDYAIAGRIMLERYYPEALKSPIPVDGFVLAKRMKLGVRRVRFAQGSDVLGRIYFDWTWVRMRDAEGRITNEKIPPMTILINRDLCRTAEMENSTLIHECCHVFLDLLFFKLQMLSGKPFTSYTSRKRRRKKYGQNNTAIDWMELQAEKLPAYVSMEEGVTKKEIERLLAGRDRSPESMFFVMCRLASTFRVSRSKAKYRMIELGYPEAEGIYVYINDERIPDHGCGKKWDPGITYTISRVDAANLLQESKGFRNALESGCYSYVDGHYCLDDPAYIKDGYRRRLTEYARHHIEECCISFSVGGRYTNAEYADCQAARKKEVKDKYLSRHSFDAEPETKKRVLQNKKFSDDAELWMDLKLNMPESFGEAVQKIIDTKGISQNELGMRMGVSRSAVRKWCAGKPSLSHVVALCIGMEVRADIGLELVRLAGLSFQNTLDDKLLLSMLFETKELTVARANEIMRQNKLAPIAKGEDEKYAC